MNKRHATDSRTPPAAAAILASIHCPVTRTWIAGLVKTFTIPRGALKQSSCLTSGFVLAAHGSPFSDPWRGTVPDAVAPPGSRQSVPGAHKAPCNLGCGGKPAPRSTAPTVSGAPTDPHTMGSGCHRNASEVVREALRRYETALREDEARIAAIRSAIAQGRADIARGACTTVTTAEDEAQLYAERTERAPTQRAAAE